SWASFRKGQRGCEELTQHGADWGGGVDRGRPIELGECLRLGHIASHRELHLDRVNAVFGAAVMARPPARLEAAVEVMASAAWRTDICDRGFRLPVACTTAIGADVERRQLTLERARHGAAYRMCVIEDDAAMRIAQAREFG